MGDNACIVDVSGGNKTLRMERTFKEKEKVYEF